MPPELTMTSRRSGFFARLSRTVANASGHPLTFVAAAATVAVWAALGPIFHFSDSWQLVINTGTTIITFLMVFLIQCTQNKDTHALQIKLDELIRVTKGHNALMELEELTDTELEAIRRRYLELAKLGRESLRTGEEDTDSPALNF